MILSGRLDLEIYRRENPDLAHLSSRELRSHFGQHGFRERRSFTRTHDAASHFSMRWLRGDGIEIGAGSSPTPLFGGATAVLADSDPTLKYGGSRADSIFSIDDDNLAAAIGRTFDFVVASHVLEHADSFIRAVKNTCDIVAPGGVVYIVLPDIDFLHDREWMPSFSFEHHVEEFSDRLVHAEMHDDLIKAEHRRLHGNDLQIPPDERFLHHKHNYRFHGWTKLLVEALTFLGTPATLADAGYGRNRYDCHYILLK